MTYNVKALNTNGLVLAVRTTALAVTAGHTNSVIETALPAGFPALPYKFVAGGNKYFLRDGTIKTSVEIADYLLGSQKAAYIAAGV